MKPITDPAREALEEIQAIAMNHPLFDSEAYEADDVELAESGDASDWTAVAILCRRGLGYTTE